MRVVLQRVSSAKVEIEQKIIGQIAQGLLLLVAFSDEDKDEDLSYMANKILNLRIFEDQAGKMNLSLLDIKGEILSVSQFTLYGDVRRGRRPSFTDAAQPAFAEDMYNKFNEILRESTLKVERGLFGGDMQVSLVNDGPVTILLDSQKKF